MEDEQDYDLKIISALIPAVPLKEAAKAFTGGRVKVVGGRFEILLEKMAEEKNVDLISAGAEYLVDVACRRGLTEAGSRKSLGVRTSCLNVQKNNPKDIKTLEDLLNPDVRVGIATEGCTLGMWEEIVNKSEIPLDEMKAGTEHYLMGCGALIGALRKDSVDAVFGWTTFALTDPDVNDHVILPKEQTIRRSTGVAVTTFTRNREMALDFIEFLLSDEVYKIYKKYGWDRPWQTS